MKIKYFFIFIVLFFNTQIIFSQTVERLVCTSEMNDLNYNYEVDQGEAAPSPFPSELGINERENEILISTPSLKKSYILVNDTISEISFNGFYNCTSYYRIPGYILTFSNNYIRVGDENNLRIGGIETGSGICFVLKKGDGYIVYGVDKNGSPLAIDTSGKKYNSLEAIENLKEYDPEKYEYSAKRAEELELRGKFDLAEVLIWGNTYYNTASNLKKYWTNRKWLYPDSSYPICYDLNGYGYQFSFEGFGYDSIMVCVNHNGDWEYEKIVLNQYSEILKRLTKDNRYYCYGFWIVMPTGNAYYLISDKTETEVFRIRNTWDSTNLYALAINGYTEDFYGDYVKEVLSKMSKADLRLLRNTVFALYGVHFKSEDLAKYFEKQVWYTDEGKSSGEVTLPENRQKLVEMILKLEK